MTVQSRMVADSVAPLARAPFPAYCAGITRESAEEAIARSGAPVLITGETGTGKEATARRLHGLSKRTGPFIAVNCGAFSDGLIEAELFGHEAGAFTGAIKARPGWFEAANGGTLLLDEIGDLPPDSQSKLLRVLQESEVTRLGSRKPVRLDVRVFAATNVDLEESVRNGSFRADLYYRLNVAPIHLPPLRERPADIVPLARYFITRHSAASDSDEVRLSPEAAARLESHRWPGNIRELENAIHFALVVCRNGEITAADISLIGDSDAPIGSRPATGAGAPLDTTTDDQPGTPADAAARSIEAAVVALLEARTPDLFRTIEELVTKVAYDRCAGNQAQSARLLGITRNTMRTLLQRSRLLPQADARAAAADVWQLN